MKADFKDVLKNLEPAAKLDEAVAAVAAHAEAIKAKHAALFEAKNKLEPAKT